MIITATRALRQELHALGIAHRDVSLENVLVTGAPEAPEGLRLIDEVPKKGAHGCRIAFVHPSSTGGVLVELVEHAD